MAAEAFAMLPRPALLFVCWFVSLCSMFLFLYWRIRKILLAAEQRLATHQEVHAAREALFSIYSVVKPGAPLPQMGGWAISPDFGCLLVSLVNELKPRLVVEASSGVSTILAGYCLKQAGTGNVISLEHDEEFSRRSSDQVRLHGLEAICRVVHAPLVVHSLGNSDCQWYDISALTEVAGPIDLLVIDGPPASSQPDVRYPALPLLFSRLGPNAVIILDDANRPGETDVVKRWISEFPEFELELIGHEKGTALLRRVSMSQIQK